MLAMLAFVLAGCSGGGNDDPINPTPKPEEVKAEITIDSSIVSNGLSFGVASGEQTISFSANTNWTLSVASTTSGATWCKASATSGSKGTADVKFTVDENTGYDDRSVSVTIKAGSVSKTFTITQKGADALLVTTNKYEVVQEGGKIEVEVKANINYELAISETAKDWITESKSKSRALTTYKHSFEITANEEVEKREGEITFKSGDKVETVKVYQAGGAVLLLSKDEFTISDVGETISVDIKSNVEYGVQMPDVDWITDEASSRGMSSHTLKYVISPNEGYDSRSAEIIFYDKNSNLKDTLKVIQAQKDAIVISQKIYDVKAEGETIEVKLSANVDFEITMPEVDWIEQVESRGLKEHTLYFKVVENEGEESRETKIVFTNKESDLSDSIAIKQSVKSGYSNGVVKITKAGSLEELLGVQWEDITSLTVIGPINGTDVYFLRKMINGVGSKLTELNLLEATIVEGGRAYYSTNTIPNVESFKTTNNVIGKFMFVDCVNLSKIILPNNAEHIDESAFKGCSSLTSIVIPENVKSIWNSAFRDCGALTTIAIPTTVKTIGESAFRDCGSLASVTIPMEVTELKNYIFYGCSSLTSISIPEKVTKIGEGAFRGCSSLTSITIPEGVSTVKNSTFEDCASLTFVLIPESVTQIGDYVFKNCRSLASIDIPETVTSLGAFAFYNCSSLNSIKLPNGIKTIGASTFFNCVKLSSINIPDGVTSVGMQAFRHCSSLTDVIIPNGLTKIEPWAFGNCKSILSAEIPGTVTFIGEGAFEECTSLTSIVVPKAITSIEPSTFKGCSSLREVGVPETVTSIGESTFENCVSLASINIPDSLKTIAKRVFLGCSSLKEVIIPDKVASIEQEAFSGSSFNKIIIGKNVTKIGIYSLCTTCNTAEYYCYAVTPPTLEQKYTESPFTKESKATAKLYVPTGCAAVYRSSHWKQYFNNIIEMD